jgi:hypothetical protein
MRKFQVVSLTALTSMCLFIIAVFVGCEKDPIEYNDTTKVRPCENVVCLNGGTCNDGVCYCANGYEGINCNLKWNDRYTGNYKVSDNCYTGSNGFYTINILPNPSFPQKIRIQNMGTLCPGLIFDAVINPEKTTFEIPLQAACGYIYVKGNGSFNNEFINIYLEQRDSLNHTSTNCSLILDKQ